VCERHTIQLYALSPASQLIEKFVVVGMRPNPEPKPTIGSARRKRAMPSAYTCGVKYSNDLFEIQAMRIRVGFELTICFVSLVLHLFRQL